jgi:hypothetical protein
MTPKDKYSSGSRDSDCWAELHSKTKGEADAKRKEYLTTYPPMGYATTTDWEGWVTDRETGDRYYLIRMSRWHSCD